MSLYVQTFFSGALVAVGAAAPQADSAREATTKMLNRTSKFFFMLLSLWDPNYLMIEIAVRYNQARAGAFL
jgi:hypothetical protein